MEMGRVPVIISDAWVEPIGPKWAEFSVRVLEADVSRLIEILEPLEDHCHEMGRRARDEWLRWFSPDKQFNYIVDSCVDIRRTALVSEQYVRLTWPAIVGLARIRASAQRVIARLA
jgi:hypothetical protein